MIETFRNDITLRTLLQRIITNLMRRIDRFFQITGFQNTLLIGILAPDARKTIRLQLNTH